MPIQYFLAKTEPSTFSIEDFQKENVTLWDGVHNYQAINVIKTWRPGDIVLIYHSGKERSIVGISKVIEEPFENTEDTRYSWACKLELIRVLNPEERISLTEIKTNPDFQTFQLVTHSRLSVMQCPHNVITWIRSRLQF